VLSKLLRYILLGIVLLLVFLASALLAMRFAIHGREVRVPSLAGLTPAEAERVATASGLVVSVDRRFYTSQAPRGRIVSQAPAAETPVRRGWRVLVAESLGPQRAAIPNLIGQSQHAADINITRRGLEVGSLAELRLPGAQPETVLAQSPPPETKEAATPRVSLVFSAPDNAPQYVMPSFVGRTLHEAAGALDDAGFSVGKVWQVAPPPDGETSTGVSRVILRQYPPAGQKVAAGTAINFEVSR
jgi:beta-lactam-binding protein with PASTA domain